jgi:hypothetical protein
MRTVGKTVPVPKNHAMKACKEGGNLYDDTRGKWVVSFTMQQLYLSYQLDYLNQILIFRFPLEARRIPKPVWT